MIQNTEIYDWPEVSPVSPALSDMAAWPAAVAANLDLFLSASAMPY